MNILIVVEARVLSDDILRESHLAIPQNLHYTFFSIDLIRRILRQVAHPHCLSVHSLQIVQMFYNACHLFLCRTEQRPASIACARHARTNEFMVVVDLISTKVRKRRLVTWGQAHLHWSAEAGRTRSTAYERVLFDDADYGQRKLVEILTMEKTCCS